MRNQSIQPNTLTAVGTAAINGDLQLLSIEEFAERAGGMSPWTVRKHVALGTIESRKVFGRRLIPISQLRKAIEQGI